MAKRGAEFQITKDNDGGFGGGGGGGGIAEGGGIAPQRATAQQMAKRKLATGRRTRVGTSPGVTGPTPGATAGGGSGGGGGGEMQSTFNFGAPAQTNGWSGAFGSTTTTFGNGASASGTPASTAAQPPKNLFGSTTMTPFGNNNSNSNSGTNAPASTVNFDFASSSNPFSFGASTGFGAGNNGNSSNKENLVADKAPTFSFGAATHDQKSIHSHDNAVATSPSAATPPSSFASTTPPNPFFSTPVSKSNENGIHTTASVPPTNPFTSGPNIFTPSTSSSLFASPAAPKAPAAKPTRHTFSPTEIEQVQRLLDDVKSKYQTADAFKVDVRSKAESIVRDGRAEGLFDNASIEQQVEKFVHELQTLQPQLATTAAGAAVEFPADSYKILAALLPSPTRSATTTITATTNTSLFAPQPTSSQPASTNKPQTPTSSTFAFPAPASQPASNPFSPSVDKATPATGSSPSSTVNPADLRHKIITSVMEQVKKEPPSGDMATKVRAVLSEVLSQEIPRLALDRFPLGMTMEQLQEVIVEAVEEVFAKLDNSHRVEDKFRSAIEIALPKIYSTIQTSMDKALQEMSFPKWHRIVDSVAELQRVRKECESLTLPSHIPYARVQVNDMTEDQRRQARFSLMMIYFQKAVGQLWNTCWIQPAKEAALSANVEQIVQDWIQLTGVTRAREHKNSDFPPSIRWEARPADPKEWSNPRDQAHLASTSPAGSPSGSHTSQMFASIAGSPSKASGTTTAATGASPNLFGPFGADANKPASSALPASSLSASTLASTSSSVPAAKSAAAGSAQSGKPAAGFTPSGGSVFGASTAGSSPFAPKTAASPATQSTKPAAGFVPQGGFKPTGGAAGGANFFAQFAKKADDSAAKAKEKRKMEDYDSEEETEEEWEKRDAEEQAVKRQKLHEASKAGSGFTFKPTGPASPSDAGKGSEADNEESEDAASPAAAGAAHAHGSDAVSSDDDDESSEDDGQSTPQPAVAAPGRSLFDRVTPGADSTGQHKASASPAADKTWKPDTPIKFGSTGGAGASLGTTSTGTTSIFGTKTASETAAGSNPFGSFGAPKAPEANKNPFGIPSSTTTASPANPFAKANPFASTANSTPKDATADKPSFNFISPSPQKEPAGKPNGLFSSAGTMGAGTGEKPKSLFGFSSGGDSTQPKPFDNPFAKLAKPGSLQSIADAQAVPNSLSPGSIFASAGTSRATSPGMTTGDESTGSTGQEESTPDPQLDLSSARAGEENEEVLFEVRAKGSELTKGGASGQGDTTEWVVRGVGDLRVLKNKTTGKCRILLRAGPTSKVVLNTSLLPSTAYTHPTPKSVSFVASAAGSIAKWTLQVGKAGDAEKLYQLLDKHKHDGA